VVQHHAPTLLGLQVGVGGQHPGDLVAFRTRHQHALVHLVDDQGVGDEALDLGRLHGHRSAREQAFEAGLDGGDTHQQRAAGVDAAHELVVHPQADQALQIGGLQRLVVQRLDLVGRGHQRRQRRFAPRRHQ
jgi:hypothetical protein